MWIVDYPVAGKGGGRDRVSFVTLDQYQRWFQGKFHFSPDVPANATSPAGLRAPSVKEMKFDDAVKLGEYLRTQTVWLRELTRIFNLPRERQAKEIDDFIKVYRAETGIQIVMLDKATAETKYKLGPKNWGHYASEEKKIYMHPDVFDHPNSHVGAVNEIGHEVGAVELHRIIRMYPDAIPRFSGAPVGTVTGEYLTHILDLWIKRPD